VLLLTSNYHGFRCLEASEVPEGHAPGIAGEPGAQTFPDDTRRYYLKG
jgi:hypothetical protein